jgi:hypothetical protein
MTINTDNKGESMRHLILALLCLTTSVSFAQLAEYDRKLSCGKTKFVLEALTKMAKEKIIWVGDSKYSDTQTVVMINTETLTWTVVQYDKTMACVLNNGEGFKIRDKDSE